MDVFIKKFVAGNAVRACRRQRPFTVGQRDIARRLLPDDVIEPAVTSETQGIQIARGEKFLLSRLDVFQCQRALAAAETQLRKTFVNLFRLIVISRRLLKLSGCLGFHAGIEEALPVI